jgi:ubiquinone/menaquinone biosynthesis C-methylase UbiE
MADRRGALPAPVVDPTVYDTDYYLHTCAGHEEWTGSDGVKVAGIFRWALGQVGFAAGETLVDIGTGRAEIVALAAEQGARQAIGIEYSADALSLARQTIAAHGVADNAHVMLADARKLPLPDASVDVVTMLDVVEHLAPAELSAALAEVARCLRPSSTIYNVTYRIQRNVLPWRRRSWPADPRNDWEHQMHVNEQTTRRLARALRDAGLAPTVHVGKWVYADFVPSEAARRTYHLLAKLPLTARFGVANIWAIAHLAPRPS